jgi:hypothetical protein
MSKYRVVGVIGVSVASLVDDAARRFRVVLRAGGKGAAAVSAVVRVGVSAAAWLPRCWGHSVVLWVFDVAFVMVDVVLAP